MIYIYMYVYIYISCLLINQHSNWQVAPRMAATARAVGQDHGRRESGAREGAIGKRIAEMVDDGCAAKKSGLI